MNLKTFAFICVAFLTVNAKSQTLKVGDKAPDFTQTMLDGSEFTLSNLKGKVVLIDFWASWCVPCRRENPFLIKAYNTYKDEEFKVGNGFEIVSVSFDSKKDAWEKAVKDDGMLWQNHVSDLRGWLNVLSKDYKIKSLPTNYLIDENGVILAVNLRGDALEKKLRKLKKGFF